MRFTASILFFVFIFQTVFAQSEINLEELAKTPKTAKKFDIQYKILLPRPDLDYWDKDFNVFYKFVSKPLSNTQSIMTYQIDGVETMVNPNSVLPHSQLDTLTKITDSQKLLGVWRMVSHRNIRFEDSVVYRENKIYRSETLLAEANSDDAFAVFESANFKLMVKEANKTKFKAKISSKYKLENQRYLMLYKYFKASSGVSQIGIDENGYLIINYPRVIENKKPKEYITYIGVLEQMVFEKVK
jgi:hypothetical protein